VLLHLPGGDVLIDTSPEMRLQLLRERVPYASAVLFTHAHVDHLFGLDDARMFPRHLGGPLPVYCEAAVEATIRRVFAYAFTPSGELSPVGGIPKLAFRTIEPGVPFEVLGERVLPIRLEHGHFRVLGFRIGDMAYCTDVSAIPEESWPMLEGLEVLVLDALRPEPHPTHFCLAEALAVVERLRPGRTYFTHMSHQLDHAETEAALPPRVALAYDGLLLPFG
jgi:phosphoribosyl 1,2-cyclic phosphate phosphodiesterase